MCITCACGLWYPCNRGGGLKLGNGEGTDKAGLGIGLGDNCFA